MFRHSKFFKILSRSIGTLRKFLGLSAKKPESVCKEKYSPGYVFLNNAPSYEKQYRNSKIPRSHYVEANKAACQPAQRKYLIKSAFTEFRTCYEVLVPYSKISRFFQRNFAVRHLSRSSELVKNDLFKNIVQRFNERISVDSLKKCLLC